MAFAITDEDLQLQRRSKAASSTEDEFAYSRGSSSILMLCRPAGKQAKDSPS